MRFTQRQEAQVRNNFRNWSSLLAAAVCVAVLAAGTVQQARGQAAGAKNWKDQAEYDMFNAAANALATNPAKAISDLDSWKQKYPSSDFKDEGTVLYVQAYASAKQPAKAIDAAADLINRGVDTVFPD